jgi:hypothetical protein
VNLLLEAARRASDRGIMFCIAGCCARLVRLMHLLDVLLDAVMLIGPQRACDADRDPTGTTPTRTARRRTRPPPPVETATTTK